MAKNLEELERELTEAKKAVESKKAEIANMEDVLHKERVKINSDRVLALANYLESVPGLLGVLAPEHDRTSCSDAHPNNGFGSTDNGNCRCVRCALIEMRKDHFVSFDFKPSLRFDPI